jgi:hypothetical protein
MRTLLVKLLAFLGFTSSAVAADLSPRVGDCWSYASRSGEEASFLVIRKIETLPKVGEVFHVSVFGLKIKSPSAPTGFTDHAGHLPISGLSLRASLKERIQRTIPEVDWTEGYNLWRQAYDAGKGGVFTESVSECVRFMEEAINRGKPG